MKDLARFGFIALIIFELSASRGYFPVRPDYSWLGLVLTALLAWSLLEIFTIPPGLFLLTVGDVILDAGSDMFNLYSRVPHWDKLLHFLGGAMGAALVIYAVSRYIENGGIRFRRPMLGLVVSTVLVVAGFGMLYEAQEFLTDKYYHHYQKQLGDGPDTIADQLFNVFGASIVGGSYALLARRSFAGVKRTLLAYAGSGAELPPDKERFGEMAPGRVQ